MKSKEGFETSTGQGGEPFIISPSTALTKLRFAPLRMIENRREYIGLRDFGALLH
jgi:hypothetical protein